MTWFNAQSTEKEYRMQFGTESRAEFEFMQTAARACISHATADMRPPKKGVWVWHSDKRTKHKGFYYCIDCGLTADRAYPYCHCGRQMDYYGTHKDSELENSDENNKC